jgi:GPH family glycoside/pentoside/hexuronide:cation symporter
MGKLIYAYVTYLFLILMYASTVVPYVGLLAAITNDPAERLSINSYRFPLAKMSFLICSALVPMFVSMYDKAHEAQAYQGAMAIISILATVFLLICFWGTKERNMTSSVKADKISKEPLINQLKLMFKTGPIVYYYLAHMTGIVAFTLQGSVAIYFVKYYLNQGGNFVSGLLSAMAVAGILGPFIAIFLIQKGFLNKLKLLKLSAVGMGTVALCLFFIPADYLWLAVSALVLSTLFNGVGSIVTWALPADCADYCEVHHNKKMSGVIGAGALFAMKFGMSIAGGLVGWILSMVGYQANAAITPNISLAILVLISVFPAVFKYASYFFLRLYSLDDIETEKIKQELQQRYASS